MDTQKLNDWKEKADKLLESSRDFMISTDNKTFARGIIGELLTFSQLISKYERELIFNENKIKYYGSSKKGYDFKLSLNGCDIEIDSKATTNYVKQKPRWVRQHARKFCEFLDNQDGTKNIIPRKDNFFYIYVDVKKWLDDSKADFYILSNYETIEEFGSYYKQFAETYELDHNGEKRKSDDMWVEYDSIKKYKDNDLTVLKKYSENKSTNNDVATSPGNHR